MSQVKRRRPVLFGAGVQDAVQALTGASTGTEITPYGITRIVSTGGGVAVNHIFGLRPPEFVGQHKLLLVDNNSTKETMIRTLTSTHTFFGSTKNSLTFATGFTTGPPAHAHLVGLSTSQWAVLSVGRPLPAIAVTGSTATAASDFGVTVVAATA